MQCALRSFPDFNNSLEVFDKKVKNKYPDYILFLMLFLMIKASDIQTAKLLAVLDSIHKRLCFHLQIRFGLACLTWH